MVDAESQDLSAQPAQTLTKQTLQRIVLTGFMGAGKSTVGRLLAQRLKWKLIDVDLAIEANVGMTITDVFRLHGESYFRDLEYQTIGQFLDSNQLVLALGGGAIENDRTRALIFSQPETQVVHLEVSLDTVLQRCKGTEGLRPILADRANLSSRYDRRLPLYRQAHRTVNVDSLPPEAVVDAVVKHFGLLAET